MHSLLEEMRLVDNDLVGERLTDRESLGHSCPLLRVLVPSIGDGDGVFEHGI